MLLSVPYLVNALPPASDARLYWELLLQETTVGPPDQLFDFRTVEMLDNGILVSEGQTYSASSSFDGTLGPSNAFDGVYGTRWASAVTSGTEWLRAQFSSPVNITEIGLAPFDVARAPGVWDLRKSNDGVSWETVKSFVTPSGWIDDTVTYRSASQAAQTDAAQYARILIDQSNGGSLAADWVEAEFLLAGVDQATGGTASASSEFDGSLVAANAFDNNSGTRWASAVASTAIIEYDFGTPKSFDAISITPFLADRAPRIFRVETSVDGVSWDHIRKFRHNSWSNNTKRTFDLTDD